MRRWPGAATTSDCPPRDHETRDPVRAGLGANEHRISSLARDHPVEHAWEREALAYVRQRLPAFDPYRAWATFEFISRDGKINEIDLLVLSPTGLFLVEIKSWPGTLTGDVRDWVVEHEGRRRVLENPLFLTDRKAKRLSTLLAGYSEFRRGTRTLPFIQPLVFLSAPALTSKLSETSRQHVYLRDESPE